MMSKSNRERQVGAWRRVRIDAHQGRADRRGSQPVASGSYEWENRFENGVWTYHLEDIWTGLQECYRKLRNEVLAKYRVPLQTIGAIGFSGMMHGYLALNKDGNLLAPFRTWRNTITGQAAEKLTALFGFNIPQRWSIAHLYQAILNRNPMLGTLLI